MFYYQKRQGGKWVGCVSNVKPSAEGCRAIAELPEALHGTPAHEIEDLILRYGPSAVAPQPVPFRHKNKEQMKGESSERIDHGIRDLILLEEQDIRASLRARLEHL